MQKLVDGLTRQLAIYEKLYEKTMAEKEAYFKADEKLFMTILSERSYIIGELTALEAELKPFRDEWINTRDAQSNITNKKVAGLVGKIKDMMDNILKVENGIIEEKMKESKVVTGVVKSKAINKYKNI